MDDKLPRLVIFISGSGSNLQAIIDAVQAGRLTADIALVVSNRKDAYGLGRAAQAGIPALYVPFKPYREAGRSREEYDRELAEGIRPYSPRLIVLAGWMHVFSAVFLDQFPNQVINLHPALPGMFPGTHAIERAYEAFQKGQIAHSGCMVHYVIPEVDAGTVIAQTVVDIEQTDSLADFEARMHTAEHHTLVQAVQILLSQ